MNSKERNKYYVIKSVIDCKMTAKEAAETLGLSERQIYRLKKGVLEEGDSFIIHKNKGRKPKHAISDKLKKDIIKLKTTKYSQANFTHFQELLAKHEEINLSNPSIYRILSAEGIQSPKNHRKVSIHKHRKRKSQKGMLVQIDASPHTWIVDKKPFALSGAIDDATGEILALFFTENECLEGYFEVMRQIISKNGIPLAIYADRHSIFRSPKTSKITIEDELKGIRAKDTQFGRAMKELGINLIYAKSAQAKGRIERLWETLQSRLPMELDIADIKTMAEANLFLQKFIEEYNKRFSVSPRISESAFRHPEDDLNLNHILCLKHSRKLDNGCSFSFGGSYYKVLETDNKVPVIPRTEITVLQGSDIGIRAEYKGSIYEVLKLDEPVTKEMPEQELPKPAPVTSKPSPNHPWIGRKRKLPPSFYEESDREIMEALYSSRLAWR